MSLTREEKLVLLIEECEVWDWWPKSVIEIDPREYEVGDDIGGRHGA